MTTVLTGFSTELTHRQATRLAADPAVARVEQNEYLYPDHHVTCTTTGIECQLNPASHLDRIDQRSNDLDGKFHISSRGTGADIYILDSGLYAEVGAGGQRLFHQTFGGRASWGRNVADDNNNAHDCFGHGTQVAGLAGAALRGVARGARIIAVKITSGCNSSATTNDMTAGINWATSRAEQTGRPGVINISYGSRTAGFTRVIQRLAVESAIQKGMVFVASAGNGENGSGLDACGHFPAAFSTLSGFLAVGSVTQSDRRSGFSNWGSCVSLFAPGERSAGSGIWTTCPNSLTAGCTFRGTSAATPLVAGVAAVLSGRFTLWSPAVIEIDIGSWATINAVQDPKGSPNRLLYVPAYSPPPG